LRAWGRRPGGRSRAASGQAGPRAAVDAHPYPGQGDPVREQDAAGSAELARTAHAELGDTYTVEVLGDDIVYHRASGQAAVTGVGAGRIGVVSAGRALRMTGQSGVPSLGDWDF
jgi:hypothetical protein